MLRKKGVVGKFVEFYGPGLAELPLADRATIANMAPEYGATCGIFPVDAETLRYLRSTGRPRGAGRAGRGVLQGAGAVPRRETRRRRRTPTRSNSTWRRSSRAWPGRRRPQDRVRADGREEVVRARRCRSSRRRRSGEAGRCRWSRPGRRPAPSAFEATPGRPTTVSSRRARSRDGSVVIAAITSCTNTSNPSVMMAAGLLAKKAVAKGLTTKPWVKTSLAPGSKVVTDYLTDAGLLPAAGEAAVQRRRLRLYDLHRQLRPAAGRGRRRRSPTSGLVVVRGAVRATATSRAASTPRCGRTTSPRRRWSSPTPSPAGSTSTGTTEPLGTGTDGQPVFLKDIWPTQEEVQAVIDEVDQAGVVPAHLRRGVRGRRELEGAAGADRRPVRVGRRAPPTSRNPPYFEGMTADPAAGRRHHRGPGAGRAGRQHHDRPHLAGREHQEGQPGRAST